MNGLVRVLTAAVDVPRANLGAYAPEAANIVHTLQAIVLRIAGELAPNVLAPDDAPAELELRTTFVRLEPDTSEKPFATVSLTMEVCRRATGQVLYTRKAEAETRRLLQAPVPVDDPRFDKTALGRAVLSCLRSTFSGLVETFQLA